jgi:predicted DNA-binding transcriptional regulator YafY
VYGSRPTTRLLSMLELLQARGKMGGPELARRLEVGERTVRRYVAMLQEMGVPVEAERGRYGAYALRPGFRLPPMMFTDEEALALALGLLSARRLGLSGVAPAVEGAQAKLERVMPEELRERVRTFEEVVIPATTPEHLPAERIVVTMSDAVRERKQVWIRYRSDSCEETERAIDPYAVVQGDAFWYTFGYCHLRQARRLFRLDRVVSVEVLDLAFELPSGFDTPEGVLEALAGMREDSWFVEVLLETTIGEARGQLPKMGVSLQETPEGVVMRSSTSDLAWMSRVLAGLSFPFVVRRPSELCGALQRLAAEIVARAGRPEGSEGERQ